MLYVLATPIGNLEDISLRALRVLQEADYVICEDTRTTRKIFQKYEITNRLVSYHQHTDEEKRKKIIDDLKNGLDIALVSESGTPGISDPGYRLISESIKEGVDITTVPGPAALAAALSICGFKTSIFIFYGFLPHKKGRRKILEEIAESDKTIVLYESVHRIKKLLSELEENIPEREIFLGRELTKKFEEKYWGKAGELKEKVKEKGEFVVIISER